ncbi:VWA-like domain-containing protein [Desulfosarcina sp. OttesenSCG-928-A07]|nr:VWA-like domain-containing protein [Desulfosarcina sp. OttesenSCG-928-G17]MDL2329635.1 VWA-like domain-containing protein [Desulfosarcina sp. OttesenSCG-928-A07]
MNNDPFRASSQASGPGLPTEKAVFALTRARSALVMEHPFFATLALKLRFKADPHCRDLWTDGRKLGFNPVFAATLPDEKLVGALAHEVLHLALGHHVRRKGRDEKLWNRACDYAVNGVLLGSGFSLPSGFFMDPAFTDMSVDDIYARLVLLQDSSASLGGRSDEDAAASTGGKSGDTDRADGLESESSKDDAGSSNARSDMEDQEKKRGKTRTYSKRGKTRAGEGESSGFTGEVRDLPILDGTPSNTARQMAEQESDINLAQALHRALNMGILPAGLSRLLKKSPLSTLDWRELLRRFLEDSADCDYSWTTPNRRYIHQDIYLPSRREPRIPHVVLSVDSSGSVDEPTLSLFCAELSLLLEEWDTTLTVLFHDTEVHAALTFGRQDLPLVLTPVGGGGTDFRPVCRYIEEEQLSPSCLIWFTDLQCNRFPAEPPYPVMWICTGEAVDPPPFGETVRLHTEKKPG